MSIVLIKTFPTSELSLSVSYWFVPSDVWEINVFSWFSGSPQTSLGKGPGKTAPFTVEAMNPVRACGRAHAPPMRPDGGERRQPLPQAQNAADPGAEPPAGS